MFTIFFATSTVLGYPDFGNREQHDGTQHVNGFFLSNVQINEQAKHNSSLN
jgi:hypothetical protein